MTMMMMLCEVERNGNKKKVMLYPGYLIDEWTRTRRWTRTRMVEEKKEWDFLSTSLLSIYPSIYQGKGNGPW